MSRHRKLNGIIWVCLGLCLCIARLSAATELASDAFTGSDGTALPTHDSNWATLSSCCYNNMTILSNAAKEENGSGNIYTGVTWPNDQYSQATVVAVGDQYTGVVLRGDPTAQTYYLCGHNNGLMGHTRYLIDKYVAGTRTNVWVHASQTMAVSDVVYCEVQGTTIILKVNGSDITGGGQTDSAIASGSAGIIGYDLAGGIAVLDDWSGGDFAGGAAPPKGLLLGVYP